MKEMNMKRRMERSAVAGFTLIELLLVMVILAILAAVVVPKFTGRALQAKITAAQTDVSNLKVALDAYEIDNGSYPTTEQGLAQLLNQSASGHAYVDKVPLDPFGNAYVYRCPGTNGKDFDLFSCGPDGVEGGGDDIPNDH